MISCTLFAAPVLLLMANTFSVAMRSHSFLQRQTGRTVWGIIRTRSTRVCRRLSSFDQTATTPSFSSQSKPRSFVVIGGGLAGLSTTFHLLTNACPGSTLKVIDKSPVGKGGASAVAGGFLHPLSPRGKLVHWGLEGLAATNRLIKLACDANKSSSGAVDTHHEIEESNEKNRQCSSIVLRDEIYRVAITDQHETILQQTAQSLPSLCSWVGANTMKQICPNAPHIRGGLHLHTGSKVIHVPSYLRGLWRACEAVARERDISLVWSCTTSDTDLSNFAQGNGGYSSGPSLIHTDGTGTLPETVIYAAGDGLFPRNTAIFTTKNKDPMDFPIVLVRGQSIEFRILETSSSRQKYLPALLCGKYISPTPSPHRVIVGATHEYGEEPMNVSELLDEMKDKSYNVFPSLWESDTAVIHSIQSGIRVQSKRGVHGRMPIVGRLTDMSHDAWIFTALSSRGLLYHGLYGEILANAILHNSEELLVYNDIDLRWWKRK